MRCLTYTQCCSFLIQWASTLFLFILTISATQHVAFTQEIPDDLEEVEVLFNVPNIGTTTIPALLNEETIYLPITDVFQYLRIKMDVAPDGMTLQGFFIREDLPYSINIVERKIYKGDQEYPVSKTDLITTEDRAYLRSNLFGELFGLECQFDFRALSVKLRTALELPAIRELLRERLRANLKKLTDSVSYDRRIPRRRLLLSGGMFDWTCFSIFNETAPPSHTAILQLGGELAGGDASIGLTASTQHRLTWRDVPATWHYVADENSKNKVFSQAYAGNIGSSLPFPYGYNALGAQITNIPPIYRKAFGIYRITDRTDPDWSIELYVNNQLVDFVKADGSGDYSFEVPLSYGRTDVTLRFYGPWGEERWVERRIQVPYSFLPPGEVEYELIGGILQDLAFAPFGQGRIHLGLTSGITLNSGVSYIVRDINNIMLPSVGTSVRLFDELLLSGEYTHDLEYRGTLGYTLPLQIGLELYHRQLTGIHSPAHEAKTKESGMAITFPFDLFLFSGNAQGNARYSSSLTSRTVSGNMAVATSLFGIPAGITSAIELSGSDSLVLQSARTSGRLSFLTYLLGGFTSFRPQLEFNHLTKRIAIGRFDIERTLFNIVRLGGTITYDFQNRQLGWLATLSLDLPFTQINTSIQRQAQLFGGTVSARGSLQYDADNNILIAGRRNVVGKAAASLVGFLDVNNSGQMDIGEEQLRGLDIAINGGIVDRSYNDSITRVLDLEPYRNYFIKIDPASLENITWKPKYTTMMMSLTANRFQQINVPIIVGAEISGKVVLQRSSGSKGLSGMKIIFNQIDGEYRDSVVTEPGGEYHYIGLPVGHYAVSVDSGQLRAIPGNPKQRMVEVTVKESRDGEIIDNVVIVLE